MVTQDDDERKLSALPKPLSSAQILNAVESSVDGGVTIVLSKLAISDIGSNEAEELASGDRQSSGSIVERLALGHNRLNSLPPEFALFTRLRYLNLRHNSFSIFPDVLTLIPSLDTLDLSHNKIKSLPVYPGNLIRLRVFSLARNKIKRLPSYIVQFRKLELLQLDRNPLEWPPKAIIDSVDLQDPNKGKESIRSLFNWIDNELVEAKEFEDSGYGEHLEWEDEPPWEFPMLSAMSNMTRLPHSRSISMDSNTSTSSLMDSSHFTELSEHSGADHRPGGGSDYLGRFGTPSQEKGDVILDNFYTSSPVEGSQYDEPIEPEPMHTRTISHGSTLRKPQQSFVAGKKSLPDLRSTHNHTIKAISSLPDDRSPTYYMGSSTDLTFPPSRINDQPSASMSSYYSAASYSTEQQPDSVTPPFVTAERKSYFRRSSMINFNSSLPRPLVCLLDSSRSILFAMGQLYQTLENHVQQAVDERLSSIFKKVLDPANVNMLHLIRSLDRFDDVSQKSIPSPAVCRGLVECCRDTVSTFRKAVGLLVVQIGQTLADDPRYLRWLLLELYGTTAELSCAWQAMHPEIEYLKPFLYGGIISNGFSHGLNGISDSAGPHSDESTSLIRLRPTESPFGRRTGTARRHAGSFSSKDVEIGKELPSYDIVPNMAGGLATHTPTLRTPKRQATVPVLTSTSSSSYSFNPSHSGFPAHIRHASQGSLHLDSSSTMSPPIYTEPSGSNQTIGSDALRAIQGAVDIAPSVWDQIEESFADTINTNRELKNSLNKARAITRNLSRHISNISEGTLDVDQKLLREEAHHFLKSIIQLSSTVKIQGTSHYLSPMLKSNMVKLSKLTEEFSILLHVSSIPYSTPRFSPSTSYSKFAAYNNNNSPPIEDNLLGSSLSRSRSAQPSLNGSVSSLPAVKPLSVRRPWTREASVDSSEPG